jgi:hypothetical protein
MNELSTLIVVLGTLGGLALGNHYRQQCKHKYETIDYRVIDVYDPSMENSRPIRRRTDVTQACEKCGDPRIKALDGIWDPEGKKPQ